MCEFCGSEYHLSNAKWGTGEYLTPGGSVYWSFATSPGTGFGFSDYITDGASRDVIRDAFQAWEDVADIDFIEIADGSQTDIRLGWDQIDGPFGVVGEASSRGSKTTETLFSFTEAEIRFDSAENWATSRDVARNEVGLYQVALHEIGHAIGLDHTSDPDTIMYASDISDLDGLTPGDIAGARAFYGAAEASEPGNGAGAGAERVPSGSDTGYVATNADDVFTARAGDDVIDGRGGTDTLSLTGDLTEYTLTLSADDMVLTDRAGRDGSDTLISIERLDFRAGASSAAETYFEIDLFDGVTDLAPEDFAQIVELYIAYFNRAPDALGLAFWGNAFADGMGLPEMAALFIDQDETRATYPETMSDSDFARAVYDNVLGRVPDATGFDFWVGVLEEGAVGRDTFILSVLEGAKAAPPEDASAGFVAQMMADRQYLSDKTDVGTVFAVEYGMSDVDDAAEVMALFDGTAASIAQALTAIEGHHDDALSAGSGDFLMPLLGVLDSDLTA